MPSVDELCAHLRSLQSALICTHVSPDPDALGSAGAMQRGLHALGIEAHVYLPDPLPERIGVLLEGVPIVYGVPTRRYAAVVVVDTATRKRVGPQAEEVLAVGDTIINIDHHDSNIGWGTVNYIQSSAAASAEIVYELLTRLLGTIDAQTAQLLYAGLLDDTGSFCYSNVTSQALQCAANLVAAGASPETVANTLYFSVPERVLRLRAVALANLRMVLENKAAVVRITQAELSSCGAKTEDTEGLVDLARSVEGTVAAVFLRELADGSWKCSLRAKVPALDVNAVASEFGGGGHKAAAGCSVRGNAVEAEAQVLAVLGNAIGLL